MNRADDIYFRGERRNKVWGGHNITQRARTLYGLNPYTFKNQDRNGELREQMREEYLQQVAKDYP
jgi:hypothetical protein